MHVELFINVLDVRMHGERANEEFFGNSFITKPLDQGIEDFKLPGGEFHITVGTGFRFLCLP